MRCIGITIVLTLPAIAHASVQEGNRALHPQAQPLPARDDKP